MSEEEVQATVEEPTTEAPTEEEAPKEVSYAD